MATSTYSEAVHAALRAACNVAHPLVTYPANVMTVDTTAMNFVLPDTVLVFSDETTFDRSERNRSNPRLPRERINAIWIVEMGFNKEVNFDALENNLMTQPPRIARDPASGILQQVTLELLDVTYVHPVRGQPSQGSKVRLRFNALHKRV